MRNSSCLLFMRNSSCLTSPRDTLVSPLLFSRAFCTFSNTPHPPRPLPLPSRPHLRPAASAPGARRLRPTPPPPSPGVLTADTPGRNNAAKRIEVGVPVVTAAAAATAALRGQPGHHRYLRTGRSRHHRRQLDPCVAVNEEEEDPARRHLVILSLEAVPHASHRSLLCRNSLF